MSIRKPEDLPEGLKKLQLILSSWNWIKTSLCPYNNKNAHDKPKELTEADLALNNDIIREGENYRDSKTEGIN